MSWLTPSVEEMSQSQADLNVGRVKLGDMKEVARQELLELLDSFPGSKTLVWDSSLTGPMGLVAEYSVLRQHEVTSSDLSSLTITASHPHNNIQMQTRRMSMERVNKDHPVMMVWGPRNGALI